MFLEEILQYGQDTIAGIAQSDMSDIEQNAALMRVYIDMQHAWIANEALAINREYATAAIKTIKTQNILLESIALALGKMVMKEKNT